MPISITPDQQARVFRRMLPAVLLSVVVILAVIAAVAFWLHDIDPQVEASRADQQQTTSRTESDRGGQRRACRREPIYCAVGAPEHAA